MNSNKFDNPASSALYRWGMAFARRRRAVIAIWGITLLICALLYPSFMEALNPPKEEINGTQSGRVEQLLEHRFADMGTEIDAVVLHSYRYTAADPAFHGAIVSIVGELRHQAGVQDVLGPYDKSAEGQISANEHAAFAVLALGGNARQRLKYAEHIQKLVKRAQVDGVQAWLTGSSPLAADFAKVESTETAKAEAIGLPVAFLVLLFALGALVAALVPMMLAWAGLLLTFGVLNVLARLFAFDTLLLSFVTMIGVGIAIDYALFIVSRFCEELARLDHEDRAKPELVANAVGVALATSGRTIMFSGAVVGVCLATQLVVDVPLLRELAVGAAVVVACTVFAALTLLPAVLAALGDKIKKGSLPARFQPLDMRPAATRTTADLQTTWSSRWAFLMMRRPLAVVGLVVVVLLALASPLFGLRYGVDVGVLSLHGPPSAEGSRVLSNSFSPGIVAPTRIVVTGQDGRPLSHRSLIGVAKLHEKLEDDPRVTAVLEHRGNGGVILTAVPAVRIDSTAAEALIGQIRGTMAASIRGYGDPNVLVGGATAYSVDFAHETRTKFPLVLVLILGLSLLFLTVIFRSVAIPLKSVAMNLLATGAAIGLVVWVFQDGHGQNVLGFTSPGFVQAYVPLLIFPLVFGLSMDYEVFLVSRIREEYGKTHDNRLSVATGLARSARPISAAAAIMVAVFGCFATAGLMELKQLGFALAAAVIIDATLIRLVLVPALMYLLGAWNWWLPAPLARVLDRRRADPAASASAV
jgi:putative drug exporter of the RND superfamily